jgi:hypothetical protein
MSEEKRTPEEREVEGHAFKHAHEDPKAEQETERVKTEDLAPDPEGGADEVEGHSFKH